MAERDEIRETLIAAESCILVAIRQTMDSNGRFGAAFDDLQGAVLTLRKWRLALEAGVWTGHEPAEVTGAGAGLAEAGPSPGQDPSRGTHPHFSCSSRRRVAASKVALRRSDVA